MLAKHMLRVIVLVHAGSMHALYVVHISGRQRKLCIYRADAAGIYRADAADRENYAYIGLMQPAYIGLMQPTEKTMHISG